MSQVIVDTLDLADIEKPPHILVLVTRASIEKMVKALADGEVIEGVIVAKYNGKYYPVGNLDVLEAYKKQGIRDVKCKIIPVKTKQDLLKTHIVNSRTISFDPISILDLLADIDIANEREFSYLPARLFRLRNCHISDKAKVKLRNLFDRLCETMEIISPVDHIILPLSKLDDTLQSKALDAIIKYSEIDGGFAPPDPISLNSILKQYRVIGKPIIPIQQEEYDVSKDEVKELNPKDIQVVVNRQQVKPSEWAKPIPNTVQLKCKCGSQYVTSLKDGTVRECKDTKDDVTILQGDHGNPMFAIPDKYASFLELEIQPRLYWYQMGSKKTKHGVFVSTDKLSKSAVKVIQNMWKTLE